MRGARASPSTSPSSTIANASRLPARRASSYRVSHVDATSGGTGSGMRVKRRTSGSSSIAATPARCASEKSSSRITAAILRLASSRGAALGAVAARVRPARGRRRRVRLLPRGRPARGRAGARRSPRRACLRPPQQVPVLDRPPDGRAVPTRHGVRHALGGGGRRAARSRGGGDRRAAGRLRAGGLQRRLEPRSRRGRRDRRPCAHPCRAALGRRHELHAGPRRRPGHPGAPARDAAEARRGVGGGVIVDGHNDLVGRLWGKDDVRHVHLDRAAEADFAGGFFALFIPSPKPGKPPESEHYAIPLPDPVPQEEAARIADEMYEVFRSLPVTLATSPDDFRPGRVAAILHLEGAEPLATDLSNLEDWYERGLRSLGFTWSRANAFASGVPFHFPSTGDIGPGLSAAGEELVRRCNELGILIDLSHLNEAGFWDVARLSAAPLVATPSNVNPLCASSRNL